MVVVVAAAAVVVVDASYFVNKKGQLMMKCKQTESSFSDFFPSNRTLIPVYIQYNDDARLHTL